MAHSPHPMPTPRLPMAAVRAKPFGPPADAIGAAVARCGAWGDPQHHPPRALPPRCVRGAAPPTTSPRGPPAAVGAAAPSSARPATPIAGDGEAQGNR